MAGKPSIAGRSSRMFVTPLGRLRLASADDAPRVLDLVNESMSYNFRVDGIQHILYLIENSVLSICQMDINDSLVGFMALRDYPLIPSVHPQAWEEYIWAKYKDVDLNSRNTFFIHLVCWDPKYSREALDSMLKSVFMHDPYIHHIAMVKSVVKFPLLIPGQCRAEASFRRVHALEKGMSADQLPALYVADRMEVSPRLRIRRAVEEDNDDIVPIIEAHSQRLRELYGDYYISELVARHPESERVLLVCEHNEVAVGVMCLNTVINFEALEESFELSPFTGLRKLDAVPKKHSKDAESLASMTLSTLGEVRSSFIAESLAKAREAKQGRVTWTFDENEFRDLMQPAPERVSHAFPPHTQPQLDLLQLLEDEEEEMEYDIVNIDTDLLRVPKLLSYESYETGPVSSMRKLIDDSQRKDSSVAVHSKEKSKGKPAATSSTVSSVSATDKPPEPTRYSGKPNAFLLELFAMHHDYDERYGFDILEVAYELFPDREYCIICFPSSHPSFPLLEHFTLVTPYSSRKRFIKETLYVAHVNSIRGNLTVRRGEAYDLKCMFDICERSRLTQGLLDLFESAISSFTLGCYVIVSQNQPVGMAVLGPLEDGTTLRTQYELEPEPRRPGTDGVVSKRPDLVVKAERGEIHFEENAWNSHKHIRHASHSLLQLYKISYYHYFAIEQILASIVSPGFEAHFRWFMRELLRNSKYSTLFWISRLFSRGDSNPMKHLTSIAGHMMPVHPRPAVPNISGNKDLDKIYKDISVPFALWVLERPLTSLPKVYVNNSIVVVGASRTGLGFLESLLLGPTCQYLTFSNVTLVSEHGLPTVAECLRAAAMCVPRDGRYTDRYLKSVPFYFYLDVMTSVMVGIDRKKKCIHLKGGGVKFYDELVLTCGQQFQHPDYLHGPLQLVKEVEQGKPCERLLMDNPEYKSDRVPTHSELPENVMLINSLHEANTCLRKLLCMITDFRDTIECLSPDNQVIVYGDCIEAYCCIAALLELGIFADMITFVEPFPPEDPRTLRVNCFNNETVDERVQASLEDLGVRVFRRYYLTGWQHHINEHENMHVESLNLMSQLHCTTIPCFAMFYYGLKAIDVYAFKAINECGLVYDGGLVVDTAFETNDPGVHAAGTCVKYSRKLHASRHAHQHYCSEDVGEALAKQFLKKLDPFVMAGPRDVELVPRYSSTLLSYRRSMSVCGDHVRLSMIATKMPLKWKPVMEFESPILQSARLPGPLYYMKLRKPGIEIPMEAQQCLPHQGHSLITDVKGNYFHLKLNKLHCVDAVTCLSTKQFSNEILSQLYGKHEAFFNKLLARFQMGMIPDLYEFFVQPWLSALYQETFRDLLADINGQDVGTVPDLCETLFSVPQTCEGSVTRSRDSVLKLSRSGSVTGSTTSFAFHEAFNDGTFRSIISRYVARKSLDIKNSIKKPTDIPSECGQSAAIRAEAAAFWHSTGGDNIVAAHLDSYLNKTSVINAHYALPDAELRQ